MQSYARMHISASVRTHMLCWSATYKCFTPAAHQEPLCVQQAILNMGYMLMQQGHAGSRAGQDHTPGASSTPAAKASPAEPSAAPAQQAQAPPER
jgi:hypothetical protein